MRKNYELLEVKIVSFDNEDIIVTSGAVEPTPSNTANNANDLLGGSFDLGGLDTQTFSS